MDSHVAQFHQIRLNTAGTVVIYEPMCGYYVWIELRVPVKLRGNGCAREIVNAALSLLPGVHFVEFDPAIRTFSAIARARRWRLVGESSWFAGCLSYRVHSRVPQKSPIKLEYSHKTYETCPKVTSFHSPSTLQSCIKAILRDIEKLARHSNDV
ncbi:hypothetical protein P3T20_002235 [Paraburkholderia sp. GAS206C]|jgi:hypothetical protein